jgi:hypothetical protein
MVLHGRLKYIFVVLFKIIGRRSCMQYLKEVAAFYVVLLRDVSCALHRLVEYATGQRQELSVWVFLTS